MGARSVELGQRRASSKRLARRKPKISELQRFAREFPSEDRLRSVIADLLSKMGKDGVRITHGPTEKGKDLIFYGTGGLGERTLFACVVKNVPITGSLRARSNAKEVLEQATQAFAEPYLTLEGAEERVHCVYVLCPQECPTSATESIRHQLTRTGPINFFCGRPLLDLFVRYWPEFLWFESGVLPSYLSAIRTRLNQDEAIANLILRKTYLSELPRSFAEIYVPLKLERRVPRVVCKRWPTLSLVALNEPFTKESLAALTLEIEATLGLLKQASMWTGLSSSIDVRELAKNLMGVSEQIQGAWNVSFQAHARAVGEESGPEAVRLLSEDDAVLTLRFSDELRKGYRAAVSALQPILRALDSTFKEAAEFAGRRPTASEAVFRSGGFLAYCRAFDVCRLFPFFCEIEAGAGWRLDFGDDVLDRVADSMLITAPAGYGKTSFCKWSAIRDAERLLDHKAEILPVFVSLYALSKAGPGSIEEAFFRSPELRKLLSKRGRASRRFRRIRLYLDGLDEISSRQQQRQIVSLAREAARRIDGLQVVITARDHVIGPWLGWLPRIHIGELDQGRIKALVANWLDHRVGDVRRFLTELGGLKSLAPLMGTPLLATLILAVYRKMMALPPNKTRLYGLFVELLSGGWDAVKGVQRETRFGSQDKVTVLTRFASQLHLGKRRDGTEADFRLAIKDTLSSFTEKWEALLDEILEDGLVVKIGRQLCFSHLSFQEYLCATDLDDPWGQRPVYAISEFYKGEEWWREVLFFYVGLAKRPLEMENWVVRKARGARWEVGRERAAEIISRVGLLQGALEEAHPGYASPFDRRRVLDESYDPFAEGPREREHERNGVAPEEEDGAWWEEGLDGVEGER